MSATGVLQCDPEAFLAATRRALLRMLTEVRCLDDGPLTAPEALVDATADDDNFLWMSVKNGHWLLLVVRVVNKPVTDVLSDYLARPEAADLRGCIVVYQVKCTPHAANDLRSLPVELFSMAEMVNDPLQSCMTPQYRWLCDDEVTQLEMRHGSVDRFPKLLTTDPVCRRFNAPVGSVFEVIRHLGDEEVLYRVVTAPMS